MVYYTCSHKKAGCLGRAQVSVTEQISDDGKTVKVYKLAAVSTPEVELKHVNVNNN
jgi:hypothetical protein